jgi:hypothetical protein
MSSIINISLDELTLDPRLLMREKLDQAIIDEYADNLLHLPPADVICGPEGQNWLWDGWKRYHANRKAKQDKMPCRVTNGTFLEALERAAGANSTHGQMRSDEDKKIAVMNLLGEETWANKSSRQVAAACRVSGTFVDKIRASMTEDAKNKGHAETGEGSPDTKKRRAADCTPKTRTDSSGRQQPAIKPSKPPKVLCRHCEHRQNIGRPLIPACPDCAALNQPGAKNGKPKKEPEPESDKVLDDAGTVVPQRLLDVFHARKLYREMESALNAAAKIAKMIEESPAADAKPLDPKRPFQKFYPTFKSARQRYRDLCPSLVCPKCEGEGCDKCHDLGWITKEQADAAKK